MASYRSLNTRGQGANEGRSSPPLSNDIDNDNNISTNVHSSLTVESRPRFILRIRLPPRAHSSDDDSAVDFAKDTSAEGPSITVESRPRTILRIRPPKGSAADEDDVTTEETGVRIAEGAETDDDTMDADGEADITGSDMDSEDTDDNFKTATENFWTADDNFETAEENLAAIMASNSSYAQLLQTHYHGNVLDEDPPYFPAPFSSEDEADEAIFIEDEAYFTMLSGNEDETEWMANVSSFGDVVEADVEVASEDDVNSLDALGNDYDESEMYDGADDDDDDDEPYVPVAYGNEDEPYRWDPITYTCCLDPSCCPGLEHSCSHCEIDGHDPYSRIAPRPTPVITIEDCPCPDCARH
ncbi:hypothetical protein BG011_004890 [Mortierella polycephala]|uniref:Uncharacterized protein n=1 Tax=Mortierella polycephala TaxID=41804 RepID=A0A9P6PZ88_9FUNG|nr:hypothetical protein BG011_004890 [Mortierella polycephala]